MTELIKRRTLYDPFNPPGATRIHVFTPAVTVPPRTRGTPVPAPPVGQSPPTPADEPPPVGVSAAPPHWTPVAFGPTGTQTARTTVPLGQAPDKIELALHPPGAKAESTFSLG